MGDLYRLYAFAKRDKMDYNLAAIPTELAPTHSREPFNRNYMNLLFDLGYEMASEGYPWMKHPPGFDPNPIFKAPAKTAAFVQRKMRFGWKRSNKVFIKLMKSLKFLLLCTILLIVWSPFGPGLGP